MLASLTLTACGSPSPAPGTGSTATADSKWHDVPGTPAPAGPSGRAIRCSWAGPAGQYDPTYCQRIVDDELRRSELTPGQRAEAGGAADAVGAAIDRMTFDCPQPITAQCAAEQARRRMQPATGSPEQIADRIRQALTAAGFADIVVRPAGPADPAPRDAIVYAVPTGAGCVLGHLDASGRGGQQQVLGALAGGRCLA